MKEACEEKRDEQKHAQDLQIVFLPILALGFFFFSVRNNYFYRKCNEKYYFFFFFFDLSHLATVISEFNSYKVCLWSHKRQATLRAVDILLNDHQ